MSFFLITLNEFNEKLTHNQISWETSVDITENKIITNKPVEAQPAFTNLDYDIFAEVLTNNTEFLEAIKRRGIENRVREG